MAISLVVQLNVACFLHLVNKAFPPTSNRLPDPASSSWYILHFFFPISLYPSSALLLFVSHIPGCGCCQNSAAQFLAHDRQQLNKPGCMQELGYLKWQFSIFHVVMVLGPLLTQNVGREDEERQRFRQKRREGFLNVLHLQMVMLPMKMALSSSLVRFEWTTTRDEIRSQKKKKKSSGRSKIPQGVRNRGWALPSLGLLNHKFGREDIRIGSWRMLRCWGFCSAQGEVWGGAFEVLLF